MNRNPVEKPFAGQKILNSDYDRESENARSFSHASDTQSEEAFVNELPVNETIVCTMVFRGHDGICGS
ncbi:hypothetical protein OROMI_017327 [Orobanche minor]